MPPKPPYYAVIFISRRSDDDDEGYGKMSAAMQEMAAKQPGYLGIESVRDPGSRDGITVSYWKDRKSIDGWREVTSHRVAQEKGRNDWYEKYVVHIARVEKSYGFGDED
ncbi:antibiotic biosynthesis monooxygenase [Emcibacter sp.]|uniref:antibiotic biosynthesis monooxygenase family protein n=1 Tax=Emcibacter sp. TaxID=1979954 RepID=UPI002AA71BF1|nr:antibiotic biosynthesis monooxygenase [Emcibacter sp.]